MKIVPLEVNMAKLRVKQQCDRLDDELFDTTVTVASAASIKVSDNVYGPIMVSLRGPRLNTYVLLEHANIETT